MLLHTEVLDTGVSKLVLCLHVEKIGIVPSLTDCWSKRYGRARCLACQVLNSRALSLIDGDVQSRGVVGV